MSSHASSNPLCSTWMWFNCTYKYFPVRFWTWNNCHPISLTHFKIHDDREAPRSFVILVSERRLWVLQCWTPSNVECFFQSFPEFCWLLCFSQILLPILSSLLSLSARSALSSPQHVNVKPQNMRLMAVGCWLRSGVPFLGDGLPGVRFTHQICSFRDFSLTSHSLSEIVSNTI